MRYRYKNHTQRHHKGEIVHLDKEAVNTKELLQNDIIEPYKSRETKVVTPDETKVNGDDNK